MNIFKLIYHAILSMSRIKLIYNIKQKSHESLIKIKLVLKFIVVFILLWYIKQTIQTIKIILLINFVYNKIIDKNNRHLFCMLQCIVWHSGAQTISYHYYIHNNPFDNKVLKCL